VFAGSGLWFLFPQPQRELSPGLAELVAELRWEEPWYFRGLKRTHRLCVPVLSGNAF